MSNGTERLERLFGGLPRPSSELFDDMIDFCDAHDVLVGAALPWLAAEIGHNDGYATMLDFIHQWGGLRLYLPSEHRSFVDKVGCGIGPSTYRRLVRDAGIGSQVEVPSAWGVFVALRRTAIAITVKSGMPQRDVARRFDVTLRSLR